MAASLAILVPDEPSDRPVTKEWRDAANAALDARPRGARRRLALKLRCEPSHLTKILKGSIKTSPLVDAISSDLGISQLPPLIVSAEVLRIMQKLQGASDQVLRAVESVVDLAEPSPPDKAENSNDSG